MPLPSYARVTNLANGSSVVVRVNDRGPYAHNRVIDLSKRAAQMLDYDHVGVAQVKVEYVGRAPLDGLDESYLMASYKPGKDAAPVRGGAPEVMVAMAGSTPSARPSAGLPPFPGMMTDSRPMQAKAPAAVPTVSRLPEVQVASAAASFASVFDASDPVLPEFGPIVPERPMVDFAATGESVTVPVLGYADQRVARAAQAFAALDRGSPQTAEALTAEAIVAAWKRGQKTAPAEGVAESYVMVGTYGSAAESARLAHELSAYGRVAIRQAAQDGAVWYSVDLHPDGRTPLDGLLQQAWAHGAADAMTVRE
jgi:rare lipoprotein A